MDFDLNALLANAPNLIIAIWVIWQDRKTQEKLLEMQKWMLEQLMKLHPPQDTPADDTTRTVTKKQPPTN